MRRSFRLAPLAFAAACGLGAIGVAMPAQVALAAGTPLDQVVLDGGGNGHGVGLSQWGAYGYAVDHGWTAAQILDHYYGGTEASSVPLDSTVRVRLTNLDDAQTAVSVETGELVVEGFAGSITRFDSYHRRLTASLNRLEGGETRMFTGVMCNSYHDVWMELHEDLVQLLGIDRHAEGSY